MMQVDTPEDFVLATGTGYSVREFLALAFDQVGLDWENYVRFDERYLRPAEVDALIGDASKAKSRAGLEAAGADAGTCEDHGRGRYPGARRWRPDLDRPP